MPVGGRGAAGTPEAESIALATGDGVQPMCCEGHKSPVKLGEIAVHGAPLEMSVELLSLREGPKILGQGLPGFGEFSKSYSTIRIEISDIRT